MTGLKSYSATAGNNTALMPEQQEARTVNDGVRQIQADMAADYRDREWIEYGNGDGGGDGGADYDCSFIDAHAFRIGDGNHTAAYHAGRRCRITSSVIGTIYGTIVSSDYNTDFDSTSVQILSASDLSADSGMRVWLSTLSADGNALPIAAINGRPIDMDGEALTLPLLTDYAEARTTAEAAAGELALDFSDGNIVYHQLTADINSITISGWSGSHAASSMAIIFQQDGTGGWVAAGWPSEIKWFGGTEPIISSLAWQVDMIILTSIDQGAHIIGNYGQGAAFAEAIG